MVCHHVNICKHLLLKCFFCMHNIALCKYVTQELSVSVSIWIRSWNCSCLVTCKSESNWINFLSKKYFLKILSVKTSHVLLLTYWGWNKMAANFLTTFSNAFSWMKIYDFRLRFHWSLLTRVQLKYILALVQIMAWRRPGDKPLSEPMIVSLLTHIYVTRPQWVN